MKSINAFSLQILNTFNFPNTFSHRKLTKNYYYMITKMMTLYVKIKEKNYTYLKDMD